MLLISGSFHG